MADERQELARRLEEARQWVRSAPDAQALASGLAGVHRTARRRRALRRAGSGLALVALVALVAGLWLRARPGASPSVDVAQTGPLPEQVDPSSGPTAPPPVHLDDGSTYALASNESRVVVTEVASKVVRLRLERGGARFQVSRRPERQFQVSSGPVEVSVLGTVFALERDGDRTRVRVEAGRVRTRWPGGETVLEAGDEGWYPPDPSPPPATEAASEAPTEQSPRPPPRPHKPSPTWRELAQRGAYRQAYDALRATSKAPEPRQRVRDDVRDLFLAADSARLSGHPAEAAPYLESILARHGGHPSAPLAAFTLGRIHLQLGASAAAAAAFAQVRALSPAGELAEDALAREVEAWSRAGEALKARAAAADYARRYPDGRRLDEVRARVEPH